MIAKKLNETCACRTFDPGLLRTQFETDELLKGLYEQIVVNRPNLFSATTVFISAEQLELITKTINAIETTILNPQFRKLALDRAPTIAQMDLGPRGVFMGYDFHLSDEGPKLIEINTNAGGALLNYELAKAQQACCQEANLFFATPDDLLHLDKVFFDMFLNEWQAQRGDQKLKLIAIVDDNPEEQYLHPEFILFQRLFLKFGIKAVIVDPQELTFDQEKLWYSGEEVDLVYNRLTDFYLDSHNHQALRQALENKSIVLTPSPHHHALFANKINLDILSNITSLDTLGLSSEVKNQLLKAIPKTEVVKSQMADELWERRKKLFFKPVSGFGSKATYRGEKLTHKVWEEILQGDYVAQELISPSKRIIQQENDQTDLKLDIRAYTYNGKIQLLAARLYSGQTTNFRTSGGGFAPVYVIQKMP